MSAEMKILKCLEWCTDLPLEDQSRKSPVFLLGENECFFEFVLDNGFRTEYRMYFRLKQLEAQSFRVIFQVGFKEDRVLTKGNGAFEASRDDYFWYICLDDLKKRLPDNFLLGNFLKFLFFFDVESGSDLKIKDETNEKSVEKLPYKDTSFFMESFSEELSKLLDEGPSYDVEFRCGDQTIKAHKNILCCHSIVFASMLQSDMVEGKTGRVNIEDVDATIFQQFLRCLYTGKLPELTVENAVLLYEVADKYSTLAIKKQCAYFLIDNLCAENVCDILILADRRNDEDLKKNVMEYVIKEEIPYMGQKWTDFCKENSVLANEVYYLFCQRFREK